MTALYDEILCNFGTDTIVNSVTWSSNDQIAAMSTNTMDENENETHHVHFMSNEVTQFANGNMCANHTSNIYYVGPAISKLSHHSYLSSVCF
jgi:hypothetical protein